MQKAMYQAMGNILKTEVKAESDGSEENIKSSPPHSSYPRSHEEHPGPSSPPHQPDILFSDQITSTGRRPLPLFPRSKRPVDPIPLGRHTQLHRDIVASATKGNIPSSPPLTPTFMASPTQSFKREVPESPNYNQQMSTPTRRSTKTKKRRSRHRSSLNSQAHANNTKISHNGASSTNGVPAMDGGLIQDEQQELKGSKDKRNKEESPEASPNVGNGQVVSDSAEVHGAQQDFPSTWGPTNGIASVSTPPDAPSSKKRKTAESGSRRRRKKHKNAYNGDNDAENTTSFSGLAERLYAGRKNPGLSTSSVIGSVNDIVREEATGYNEEPTTHAPSASSPNVNDSHGDSKKVANAITASDDEMDLDYNPLDKDQSDNQDQNVSEDSKYNRDSYDEQNESASGVNSAPSSGDASKNVHRPEMDQDSTNDPEHNHSNIADRLPKKGSARKRVAKQTFFDRTGERNTNGTKDHASSSSPVAGPSKVASKKQLKVSAMLKGHPEDSPEPQVSSSRQLATPKTKNSYPHQLIKGQFSEFELRNITQAVERWRDEHNLTQVEVNDLIQGNPKEVGSHQFWSRIAATCPNRSRQKVINQCRRKFHNFVARGTWTPEQQEELKRMWEMHGNKFSIIGKLINRHPEDVRDRIRNYVVCGENRRVDPWTQEEEAKLQSIISDALRIIRSQRQDKRRKTQEPDEDLIDWQRVSELMDRTRSRLQCIQKWKLMNRQQANRGSIDGGEVLPVDQIIQNARDEAGTLSSRERYRIVKAIRACDVNSDSRIPWAKVRSQHLNDQWSRPTLMVVWSRLKHSIPDWNVMSVPEVIHRLSKKYHETRQLEYPSEDDYDPNAEYTEIERKVNRMLKVHHRTPKTPNTVIKTDDEEEGGSTEDKVEDEEDGGAESNEGSGDEDIKMDSEDENEFKQDDRQHHEQKENDKASSDQSESHGSLVEDGIDDESDGSVDLGNNVDHASIRRESSIDAPSITDFKSKKTPSSARRYGSSAKTTKVQSVTPSKRRSTRMVIDESSDEEQAPDAEDDLSSDTNASDVESIPARL
ncbi:hypothetical protein F5Y05DRAFT_345577 [Hypoxylon sp. FL0543]|nr:hypothetical protein F5Y05DRAFT_345577 [Hypoxylon sp. FL0543]